MAKAINEIDKCFVSTDCEEIASLAKENSAKVLKRPIELAKDDSPELDAWKHAICNYQFRFIFEIFYIIYNLTI